MKVVIQRVSQAQVAIEEQIVGQIKQGFMVLVGIHQEDTPEDVAYIVGKISKLRVFEDDEGKMNRSIQEIEGSILSISQFTLYAKTKKAIVPVLLKRLVQMWRFLCMNYLINN